MHAFYTSPRKRGGIVIAAVALLLSLANIAQARTPSLEETVTWQNCGTTCGATGGAGAVAYGHETLVSSPSQDGVSAQFSLDPQDPYGNFYWYANIPKPSSATTIDKRYMEYVFMIYIPKTYDTAWHAVEWGTSVRNNGWWWRSAYSLSKSSGFRYYDRSKNAWISTGVALYNFAPGTWHTVRVRSRLYSSSSSHYVQHLFIEIDGLRKTLSSSAKNVAIQDGSTSNSYKASFQLDGEKLPIPYSVYFDKMVVNSWF